MRNSLRYRVEQISFIYFIIEIFIAEFLCNLVLNYGLKFYIFCVSGSIFRNQLKNSSK